MTEKWLNDIQSTMANYETDAPTGLWEAIEQAEANAGLQQAAEQAGATDQRSRRRTHRYYIAAACTAAAVAVGGFMLFHNNSDTQPTGSKPLASNTKPTASTSDAKPAAGTASSKLLANANDAKPSAEGKAPAASAAQAELQQLATSQPTKSQPATAAPSLASAAPANSGRFNAQEALAAQAPVAPQRQRGANASPQAPKRPSVHREPASPDYYYYASPQRKRQPGTLTLALYTGGTGNATSATHSQNMMLMSAAPDTEYSTADDPRLGYAMSNADEDVVKEVKHRMPMRFGLSAAFSLTDRLALETGLTYTQLNSDLREGSEKSYYKGTQQLHYVGIPVNVKYSIYTVGALNIYASAGALVEQCVAGKKEMDLVVNGKTEEQASGPAGSTPMQLSFNAAAGLQYNFTPLVGIYAEPGVSYYVNDKSSLSTVYKEHPWNFNVSLGLRFNIK